MESVLADQPAVLGQMLRRNRRPSPQGAILPGGGPQGKQPAAPRLQHQIISPCGGKHPSGAGEAQVA